MAQEPSYLVEQRKSWRFAAACRVEYEVRGRLSVAFASDLSQGGVLLRSASDLQVGQSLTLRVHLEDNHAPLETAAEVLRKDTKGVTVRFVDDSGATRERIRAYVRSTLLPALEQHATGPRPMLGKVIDLAQLHLEDGRADAAVTLYRQHLTSNARHMLYRELYARALLYVGGAVPASAEHQELLALIGDSERLGPSAILERIRTHLEEVERLEEQRQQQAREREEAARVAAATEVRLAEERAALTAQLQAERGAEQALLATQLQALEARGREIEEHGALLARRQAQLEQEEQALTASREAFSGELQALRNGWHAEIADTRIAMQEETERLRAARVAQDEAQAACLRREQELAALATQAERREAELQAQTEAVGRESRRLLAAQEALAVDLARLEQEAAERRRTDMALAAQMAHEKSVQLMRERALDAAQARLAEAQRAVEVASRDQAAQLAEQTRERERLEAVVTDLAERERTYQETRAALEAEVEAQREARQALTRERGHLAYAIDQAVAHARELQAERQALKARAQKQESAQEDSAAMAAERVVLQARARTLAEQEAALTTRRAEADARDEACAQREAQAAAALARADHRERTLRMEQAAMQANNHALTLLQHALAAEASDLRLKRATAAALQEETLALQAARACADDYEALMTRAREEARQLREQLVAARGEFEARLLTLETGAMGFRDALSDARLAATRADALRMQRDVLEAQTKELTAQLQQAKHERDTLLLEVRRHSEDTRRVTRDSEEQVQRLHRQLNEDRVAHASQTGALQEEIARLQTELQRARAEGQQRSGALETELGTMRVAREALEQQTAGMHQELRELRLRVERLNASAVHEAAALLSRDKQLEQDRAVLLAEPVDVLEPDVYAEPVPAEAVTPPPLRVIAGPPPPRLPPRPPR